MLEGALTLRDDTRIAKKAYLDSREVAPLLRAVARVAEDAVGAEAAEAPTVEVAIEEAAGFAWKPANRLDCQSAYQDQSLNKLDPYNSIPICLLANVSPTPGLDK